MYRLVAQKNVRSRIRLRLRPLYRLYMLRSHHHNSHHHHHHHMGFLGHDRLVNCFLRRLLYLTPSLHYRLRFVFRRPQRM